MNEMTGESIKTWIFVMVLAFSRHQYAEIVLRQDVGTWLGCHRRAFEWFGAVPQKIMIDNPKCAITKACYHDPVVQRSLHKGMDLLFHLARPETRRRKAALNPV